MTKTRKVASMATNPDTDAKLANIIRIDKFFDHGEER